MNSAGSFSIANTTVMHDNTAPDCLDLVAVGRDGVPLDAWVLSLDYLAATYRCADLQSGLNSAGVEVRDREQRENNHASRESIPPCSSIERTKKREDDERQHEVCSTKREHY